MTLSKWIGSAASIPQRFRRITSGDRYVPQIDGLRFLAILPVLVWHATLRGERNAPSMHLKTLVPSGHVGVYLFFFISGYIIAFPFLSGRAPTIKAFFRRRLLRLEPPYILVMLGCFLLLSTGVKPDNAAGFNAVHAPLWQSLLASLIYCHGLIFAASPRLNPPAWSLEIEIQFYLLAPLIFRGYRALAAPGRRVAVAALVIGASFVVSEWIQATTPLDSLLQHTLLKYGWMFLVGVVACDWAVRSQPFKSPPSRLFDLGLVVSLVGLYCTGLVDAERVRLPTLAAVLRDVVTLTCLPLAYLGAARGLLGRRLLGAPWIALIGGACYSIYLIHVPCLQLISTALFKVVHPHSEAVAIGLMYAIAAPLTLVVSGAFYVWVERPCTDHQWPRKLLARIATGRPRAAPPAPDRPAIAP